MSQDNLHNCISTGEVAFVQLKNLCERVTKGSTPTSYGYRYTTSGIRFIKAENIDANGFASTTTNFIDDTTHAFLKRSMLRQDDLLFSIAGTIGRVGLVRSTDLPANTNQALAIIRLLPGLVDPKYLFYFLKSNSVQKEALKRIVGVGRSNLSLTDIGEFAVPVVHLGQQKRIVAEIEKQFSRLDEAVANLNRVKANLKRYKASVFRAACEGRLVPTEAELARQADRAYETGAQLLARILTERRVRWKGKGKYKEPATPDSATLPALSEDWTWATVDQLAAPEPNSITDGPFGSNLKTEHYTDSGPRVIRLQNIGDGIYIDEEAHISEAHFERLQKHRAFANDLVIAGFGENPPRSCIIPTTLGHAIVKADCIRFKPHSGVAAKYLNAALNSEPVRNRTKNLVHGVGRPRLNLGEIKSIVLPLPPMAEQFRIVAEVGRRLSVVEELETIVTTNLQRIARLHQIVLQQAFSGELFRDNSTKPDEAAIG